MSDPKPYTREEVEALRLDERWHPLRILATVEALERVTRERDDETHKRYATERERDEARAQLSDEMRCASEDRVKARVDAALLRIALENAEPIEAERDLLKAALRDVLASAFPHPIEHPAMTAAWKRAREALGEVES